MLVASSNILHANDVIWLICKLESKAKIFMQITKTSTNNARTCLEQNLVHKGEIT